MGSLGNAGEKPGEMEGYISRGRVKEIPLGSTCLGLVSCKKGAFHSSLRRKLPYPDMLSPDLLGLYGETWGSTWSTIIFSVRVSEVDLAGN
jgi:hypothetical protein